MVVVRSIGECSTLWPMVFRGGYRDLAAFPWPEPLLALAVLASLIWSRVSDDALLRMRSRHAAVVCDGRNPVWHGLIVSLDAGPDGLWQETRVDTSQLTPVVVSPSEAFRVIAQANGRLWLYICAGIAVVRRRRLRRADRKRLRLDWSQPWLVVP